MNTFILTLILVCVCSFVSALSEHLSGKMKVSWGKCVPQFLKYSFRYWGNGGVWANLLTLIANTVEFHTVINLSSSLNFFSLKGCSLGDLMSPKVL